MAGEIRVNSAELVQAVTNSQTAIAGMNVSLEQWENQGEKSISLEAFAQQYVELEKTMQLYQKLLEQDIETIRKIGVEFFLSDYKLAQLWKGK